jgi:hypothetical protein
MYPKRDNNTGKKSQGKNNSGSFFIGGISPSEMTKKRWGLDAP